MLYIAMIVSRPCTQFLGNLNSRNRPRYLTRPEIPHLAMRMATIYGTVSEFNPATDEWSEYVERLQFYFTANEIKDNSKKRAVLLSSCEPATFRLL